MRQRGKVGFFHAKKLFGKIVPENGQEEIFVHISNVTTPGARSLVEGEPLEFDVVDTPQGPKALNVERLEARFLGTVEFFAKKKGFGRLISDDGDVEVFVHYSQIVTHRSFKSLDEGERVEFSMGKTPEGKIQAIRVTTDARMPLERFAVLPRFDERLSDLAGLALPENWDYRYTKTDRPLPVLWSYVHYTFRRLEQEGKISYSHDPERNQKMAAFNTGLVTRYYEPIFAVLHENRVEDGASPFVLIGFFTESQHPMTLFSDHPETADYFTDPVELLYDRRMKLVKKVDHIIEDRLDRFPPKYQEHPERLPGALSMAVDRAVQRVHRNYKTAIPQFNRGKIQLLLPLCLDDPVKADMALVVGREGNVYKGHTVLTLDMAYNNARLLTRPDDEWLVP